MKGIIFKCLLLSFVLGWLNLLSGCSGNSADELYKTAQFEELQKNHEHAKILYQKIIDTYPSHDLARKAEKRLAELNEPK